MKKTQTKKTYAALEKVLAYSGLAIILIGFIASLYSAYINQRFIHDAFDFIYYFRYSILLGGGFAIGCLFVKRPTDHTQLFTGVFYALLAITLYSMFDIVRALTQNALGDPGYPWNNITFSGGPLFALFATLLLSYGFQFSPWLNTLSKKILVTSFMLVQAYAIAVTINAINQPLAPQLVLISLVVTPLFVTFICYLFLGTIRRISDRMFYASVMGILYGVLSVVGWEFRVDPTVEATNTFSTVLTFLTLIATITILWQVRHKAPRS